MNHEHMNVKNEVEPTGPKKPWVTPRLEEIRDEDTTNGPQPGEDGGGTSAETSS